MARNMGSWWIKDGIDGRRIEAQGFASLLGSLSGYAWTQDHGDSHVLEKDFVETANYTEKVDQVDAVMMSSHGNPNSFSVSNGSVSTSDTIKFGKGDLEIFATHACKLLEHTAANPVGHTLGHGSEKEVLAGGHGDVSHACAPRPGADADPAAHLHRGNRRGRVPWTRARLVRGGRDARSGREPLPLAYH